MCLKSCCFSSSWHSWSYIEKWWNLGIVLELVANLLVSKESMGLAWSRMECLSELSRKLFLVFESKDLIKSIICLSKEIKVFPFPKLMVGNIYFSIERRLPINSSSHSQRVDFFISWRGFWERTSGWIQIDSLIWSSG